MKKITMHIALLPIYLYRLVISPWLPKSCAFTPTCSEYGLIAIKRHGIFVGWWIAIKRILRCNPFNKRANGYDPVKWRLSGKAKYIV
ncbi:MAG: membrane protein insertion efficiency factor YidD [Firmicutes bacterium]|nr:membrane protein insertion efficiency factor YidD [Bacillota bacterium]